MAVTISIHNPQVKDFSRAQTGFCLGLAVESVDLDLFFSDFAAFEQFKEAIHSEACASPMAKTKTIKSEGQAYEIFSRNCDDK